MSIRNIVVLVFWIWGTATVFSQIRYSDAVFAQVKVATYTYSDTLQLDFYDAKRDTVTKKPLLVLVHGGGFASGKRDNPLERRFCMQMAKKGYAVASISYRLTRKGKTFGCNCPVLDKLKTFKEASEDILRAIQYLSNNKNVFAIDINNIILVGSSAGAEAVLNTVFMKNHSTFRSLPYGNLKFAGVISFAGAMVDKSYIILDTAVPSLFFHGKKDKLVPFDSASHHYCSPEKEGYLLLDGPASITTRLEDLDISYQLMYDTEGNHDWANLAYEYTNIMAEFIQKTILENRLVQSKIKIRK